MLQTKETGVHFSVTEELEYLLQVLWCHSTHWPAEYIRTKAVKEKFAQVEALWTYLLAHFILSTFPGVVTRDILQRWLWTFCLDLPSQIWLGTKHYKLKQLVQYLWCSLMHLPLYIAAPCLVTQSKSPRWLNWLCWWLFSCIFLTGKQYWRLSGDEANRDTFLLLLQNRGWEISPLQTSDTPHRLKSQSVPYHCYPRSVL